MQKLQQQTLSFGDYTLDISRGCLLRGEEQVKLRPKSFDVLKHLSENSGRLVTKAELMQAVWPDSFVTDDSLVQCLMEIRRALGDDSHRYIKTVPRRGYIFEAEVASHLPADRELIYTQEVGGVRIVIEEEENDRVEIEPPSELARGTALQVLPQSLSGWKRSPYATAMIFATAIVALAAGALLLFWTVRGERPATEIRSLAVLPLRSLNREAGDEYLGLGIADTIITKVSQVGGLTVRPTSAVRKYTDQEIDSLAAARELQTDAVLDGTFLHEGDRLRVSVNLLRVRDGASLWAENFDMRFTDIFAIQDEVSKEVAARLRLQLNPAEQIRRTKRHTSNPAAYSYYAKAVYHFSNRDWFDEKRAESDQTIELLRQAIALDQSYALAHARLGYAYAWTAIVYEEDNPALIEQAKQEIDAAERLDPQLAEVHVARAYIFWSQYEGWQVETAIRELRLAQQLDPQVGHFELADIYAHIGLDEQHEKAIELALKIDPTSSSIKRAQVTMFYLRAMPDEARAAEQRFFHRGPDARYFLEKRMLKEADPLVMLEYQKAFGDVWAGDARALLLALRGKHKEAEAALPALVERAHRVQRRAYHHVSYDVARIYALGGKNEEAVKWLNELARDGFPNYPLFLRDPFLEPLRKDKAFMDFMGEMKTRWEGYRREFG